MPPKPNKKARFTRKTRKTCCGKGNCLFNGGGRSKKHKRRRHSKANKKSNANRKRRYFHFLSL